MRTDGPEAKIWESWTHNIFLPDTRLDPTQKTSLNVSWTNKIAFLVRPDSKITHRNVGHTTFYLFLRRTKNQNLSEFRKYRAQPFHFSQWASHGYPSSFHMPGHGADCNTFEMYTSLESTASFPPNLTPEPHHVPSHLNPAPVPTHPSSPSYSALTCLAELRQPQPDWVPL